MTLRKLWTEGFNIRYLACIDSGEEQDEVYAVRYCKFDDDFFLTTSVVPIDAVNQSLSTVSEDQYMGKEVEVFFRGQGRRALRTDEIMQIICTMNVMELSDVFRYSYSGHTIGYLEHKIQTGLWLFYYSDWFKSQDSLQPLTSFPHTDIVYESNTLFTHFESRIPPLDRPDIMQEIAEHSDGSADEVLALTLFGEQSIDNPYVLKRIQ